MANYHLYYLKAGMLVGSDDIEADNDVHAAEIAQREGWGDLVEIWNASSRVRIVKPAAPRPEAGAEAPRQPVPV